MRVEETCRCGGTIVVDLDMSPDGGGSVPRQDRATWLRDEVWKQVDRWRKLHAICRTVPRAAPSTQGTDSTTADPQGEDSSEDTQ